MHNILETLQSPPPKLSNSDIANIAKENYAFDGVAKSLGGERDQNFLIRLDDPDGRCLTLKVANSAEPDDLLDMQCAALDHIAAQNPQLPIPSLIRTRNGDKWSTFSANGNTYRARAFHYLPGLPLYKAPVDSRLMRNLGRTLAQLNIALRGFFHPAARHAIAWDTQNIERLAPLCEYLEDEIQRDQIAQYLDHFANKIKPSLTGCRAQVIHNDMSFHNAVVDPENPYLVSGMFDFGDMLYAPLIQDLALTAAEVPLGYKDPVAHAAHIVTGFNEISPLEDQEFAVLPDLIKGRLVLGLLIDAWSNRENEWVDDREHAAGLREKTQRSLQIFDEMLDGEFEDLLRNACGLSTKHLSRISPLPPAEILQKRIRFIGNASYYSYNEPLDVVRGEGVWLYDTQGKAYLDAYNNVPHVGHCHPRVVTAVANQTATLNTNTRYLYDALTDYAERITSTLPKELDTCYFVSSGSEANDLAWRLSKSWTCQTGGLVIENAYHGITDAVFDLSPAEHIDKNAVKTHVEQIKAPDDYRGPWKRDVPERGLHYAEYCTGAIERLIEKGYPPAALFMDMILSSSGIMVPPPQFTQEVYSKVRSAGGLCVADEVQSGFGRLGKSMWGFEISGVIPDIVTFGKPIAGGYPMGLVVTRREIAEKFERDCEFFSTTGGNPVACAAAKAVLQVMEDEELMSNAERIGSLLSDGIRELAARYSLIGDVRGSGLFVGVEMIKDSETLAPATQEASAVANKLKTEGVLIGIDGTHSNVLKIRPPMVINEHNANFLLEKLGQTLSAI